MSSHKVIITGASGYIGGSVLSLIQSRQLVQANQIYAVVRKDEHEAEVRKCGANPLRIDIDDQTQVERALVDNEINIVIQFASVLDWNPVHNFLLALQKVNEATGKAVHLIHTSGARIFSSLSGLAPQKDGQGKYVPIYDDEELFERQQTQKAVQFPPLQSAVDLNVRLHTEGEELGVKTYIVAPPIVYGKGFGFGNDISKQTVGIIKLGTELKKVFQYSNDDSPWVICHIEDLAALYANLFAELVADRSPPHGKKRGYYFAENGTVTWLDVYKALAKRLQQRGFIESAEVTKPSEDDLQESAKILNASVSFLKMAIAGECLIRGANAKQNLDWKPKHDRAGFDAAMSHEVDFVTEKFGYK